MSKSNLITILGSTGDLGSQFSNHLIDKKTNLRLVVRKGSLDKLKKRVHLNNNVEVVEISTLFDKPFLEKILLSSTIVFNLTGLVSLFFKHKAFASVLLINGFFQGFLREFNKTANIPILYASTQRIQALNGREDVKHWINMAVKEFNDFFNRMTIRCSFEEIALSFTRRFCIKYHMPYDVNIYELSNALGEEFLKQNTRSIILRISSCYGPGCSTRRTVGRLIYSRIIGEKKMEHEEFRDYIFTKDMNDIFEKMVYLENQTPYIKYCCSGSSVSKGRIISEIIKNTLDCKGQLSTCSRNLKKRTFQASGQWFQEILGRKPFLLKNGIALTVEAFCNLYFRQNRIATKERLHAMYDNIKQKVEEQGIDIQKIIENKELFFTFSNESWHVHTAMWKQTGTVLVNSLTDVLTCRLEKVRTNILCDLKLKPEQYWSINSKMFHISVSAHPKYLEAGKDIIYLPKFKIKMVKDANVCIKPIKITFEGVLISINGSLFAKGFVENEDLFLLLRQLISMKDDITQKQTMVVYIKLAHILTDIPYESSERINRLYSEVPIGEYMFPYIKLQDKC
ncbi:MAG: NmrA family NAD(P)-binding protein [Candidatus Scalindua sp.]